MVKNPGTGTQNPQAVPRLPKAAKSVQAAPPGRGAGANLDTLGLLQATTLYRQVRFNLG
jgi:hypothetical protein